MGGSGPAIRTIRLEPLADASFRWAFSIEDTPNRSLRDGGALLRLRQYIGWRRGRGASNPKPGVAYQGMLAALARTGRREICHPDFDDTRSDLILYSMMAYITISSARLCRGVTNYNLNELAAQPQWHNSISSSRLIPHWKDENHHRHILDKGHFIQAQDLRLSYLPLCLHKKHCFRA
ncbi:hypothetical protein BDZ89DRAFT_1037261 [Hymenopellis radicata]|nr:hypothetical protein BDZ89DRAFT_1037261 [Hymenopellis radicata]